MVAGGGDCSRGTMTILDEQEEDDDELDEFVDADDTAFVDEVAATSAVSA